MRALKARFPGVPVVTYVNTYADVKAETDICCTSGNAVKVVESLDSDTIIFLPDEFLAQNVARETGKRILFPKVYKNGTLASISTKRRLMALSAGTDVAKCRRFTVQDIQNVRLQFPDVEIVAHPNAAGCGRRLRLSGSTTAMIRHVSRAKVTLSAAHRMFDGR